MTQQKSIKSYRRPEVSTTLCYDWIDISEIESVTEKFPYLEFKYKDGETFLIDWTINNVKLFEKLIK
jgi:hypothetical protein